MLTWLLLVVIVACPLMMFFMMRGMGGGHGMSAKPRSTDRMAELERELASPKLAAGAVARSLGEANILAATFGAESATTVRGDRHRIELHLPGSPDTTRVVSYSPTAPRSVGVSVSVDGAVHGCPNLED